MVVTAVEVITSFEAVAADTTTDNRSLPDELIEPSEALIVALSALYKAITPLLLPDTVATPLVNVIVVAVPKLTAEPLLSFTVGVVDGLVDELAPEKVRLLSPV